MQQSSRWNFVLCERPANKKARVWIHGRHAAWLLPTLSINNVTAAEGNRDVRRERAHQSLNRIRQQSIIIANEEDVVASSVIDNPLVVFLLTQVARAKLVTHSRISASEFLAIFGYFLPYMALAVRILTDENLNIRIGLRQS